jgi:hypothetical protein
VLVPLQDEALPAAPHHALDRRVRPTGKYRCLLARCAFSSAAASITGRCSMLFERNVRTSNRGGTMRR